jgi:hypothetical protein
MNSKRIIAFPIDRFYQRPEINSTTVTENLHCFSTIIRRKIISKKVIIIANNRTDTNNTNRACLCVIVTKSGKKSSLISLYYQLNILSVLPYVITPIRSLLLVSLKSTARHYVFLTSVYGLILIIEKE